VQPRRLQERPKRQGVGFCSMMGADVDDNVADEQ